MWRDASKRAANVRERAEIFKAQHFERTSELLFELAEAIERGDVGKPGEVFLEILSTYRDEYAKGDNGFLALYDFIEKTLIDSIISMKQGFGTKLLELQPQIREMNKAATIMEKIAEIFLKAGNLTKEERFYASCIVYLMDVEGKFDEACRLLYVLYKASLGQSIQLSDIENLSLRQIRDDIRQLSNGESEILFLGWQDNHLRNAIAHMRIEYDDASDAMRFVDKGTSGVEVYNEKLPYEQFWRYSQLTNGVSSVFLHVMTILGAHDMAFAVDPFRAKTAHRLWADRAAIQGIYESSVAVKRKDLV